MNFIRNKLLTIVLVLCLVFTIFVGITANRGGNVGVIQGTIKSAITPIQKYVYITGQRISNVFYFISSIASTRKENIELKTQIQKLNQQLIDYDKYKRENDELNSQLNFKNTHQNFNLLGANIIGKVGDGWFSTLILDVGEKDGVKKGQYVVSGQGYVGQVIEASSNTSSVMTILDEKANIPGKISSTGEDGLISGVGGASGNKLCKMSFLSPDTKAKPGDLIVTSNIITDQSNLVQNNILIGSITLIEDEKANLTKVAYIKPAVDFSKIEKVMVVIK